MGECLRKLNEVASVQNFIVAAAFEALEARLRSELEGCLCRDQALKAVEEYRRYAEQAARVLFLVRPRRLDVLRWVLLAAGVAAGLAAGLVLAH